MDIIKLINKIKNQQDLDLQGCSDLKSIAEYIKKLEAHRQISEETLGSVSVFLKAGDNDKAREWLEAGIKRMDDASL